MKFSVRTPSGREIESSGDANEDVLIELEDGREFSATFFTIQNVRTLMTAYRSSGEAASGAYFWAVDMVLVESISEDAIRVAVQDLVESGEIEKCCTRIR